YRAAPRLRALPLEGQKNLFDGIGHGSGVARRISEAGVSEALAAQPAAIAAPTVQARRSGIVARPAHSRIEAEPRRLGSDIGLGHVLERCVDMKVDAPVAVACSEAGERFKAADEFGAAVGIARIIEGIDPDEDVLRLARLG